MNVFTTVVCGVDGSPEGTGAARIAARVAEPRGELTLLSIEDTSIALHAGWGGARVREYLEDDARWALERGRAVAASRHPTGTQLRLGDPVDSFLVELEERAATLAVVGSHGHSRARGLAVGAVSTFLLHRARCSVLVARPAEELERWPRLVVVGIDGSPGSGAALAAARRLAVRFGSKVRAVLAHDDEEADVVEARVVAPHVEEHHGRAVEVLSALSERADLVVVGSRRLEGVRALGSVSERIAHEAKASVLVVRGRGTEPGERR
jgi:nucleotide-binding universal stress UspA family protein